jgi:hypothetical protein
MTATVIAGEDSGRSKGTGTPSCKSTEVTVSARQGVTARGTWRGTGDVNFRCVCAAQLRAFPASLGQFRGSG